MTSQLTKFDFIAKNEIFLEQMDEYSSDLSGYIVVTDFKSCKVLNDLDSIFKVIVLYVGQLLNHWMDFLQT